MKLSKKYLLILLAITGIYLLITELKPKDLCYQALVDLRILKPCYNPNKNFIEIFRQQGFDYEKIDQEISFTSLKKLSETTESDLKIPTISHHIYFAQDLKPKPLLDFYIKKMAENFTKLNNVNQNWQHYIWTNNENIFPEHIRKFKNVMVRDILELKDHALYPYLMEVIKKGDKNKAYFMEASDVLRLMLLQRFGGIYQDMDYEIYNAKALLSLMKKFDFIGAREFPELRSYYGNSVIISKANHPIINEALDRLKQYNIDKINIPDYIKYPCNLYDKLYLNSPPLVTLSYFSKNNIENNDDIILPSWMLLNVNFARFKNGDCDYAKINQEGFENNNQKLEDLITKYTAQIVRKESSNSEGNIYHNYKDGANFDIIGADMFCGTWVDKKVPKNYYWSFYEK